MDDFDADEVVKGMRALSEALSVVFKYLDDALTTITENLHVLSEAYIAQSEDTEEDFEDEDSGIPEPTDDCIKRSDALKAILGVSIYDTIEELEGARTIAENTWADGLYDAYKIIEEEVDAADVEPVRYGYNVKWDYPTLFECSLCGWECFDTVPGDTNTYQYCPNCGAKMLSEPPNPKSQKGEYNA